MSVRSLGDHYAKIFFKYFPHDTKEIITTNAKDRALSDEEIETLKKVFPNVDFTTHKEVVRKK